MDVDLSVDFNKLLNIELVNSRRALAYKQKKRPPTSRLRLEERNEQTQPERYIENDQKEERAEEILKNMPHIHELIDDPIINEITTVIRKLIRIIEDMAEWKIQPLLENLICRNEIEYKYLEEFRKFRRISEEISLKRYLDKTEAELNEIFNLRNEGKKKHKFGKK